MPKDTIFQPESSDIIEREPNKGAVPFCELPLDQVLAEGGTTFFPNLDDLVSCQKM